MLATDNEPSEATHGIMFHHFHDERHPVGQGSLSANDFEAMLEWLGAKYNILSASDYLHKTVNCSLEKSDICLTFDDALRSQYDVAVPILEKKGITAFFFIYSSPFMGNPDLLEVYRYFRTTQFVAIDDFYHEFFTYCGKRFALDYSKAQAVYDGGSYLSGFPFYSNNDKWFRFLRDMVLGKEKYANIMSDIMSSRGFSISSAMSDLWMSDEELLSLRDRGDLIGLHSYSHPTTMHLLSRDEQAAEYEKNQTHLLSVLGRAPVSMSHPCGNYNGETLDILNDIGIRIGFRSNRSKRCFTNPLEIPREDHANIMMEMRNEDNRIY